MEWVLDRINKLTDNAIQRNNKIQEVEKKKVKSGATKNLNYEPYEPTKRITMKGDNNIFENKLTLSEYFKTSNARQFGAQTTDQHTQQLANTS